MPCEELEMNEKSAQLTPEDIQLLSEYSWDMAEYTSRFGYFYLSSERENVKGLTKWQAEHISADPHTTGDGGCSAGYGENQKNR